MLLSRWHPHLFKRPPCAHAVGDAHNKIAARIKLFAINNTKRNVLHLQDGVISHPLSQITHRQSSSNLYVDFPNTSRTIVNKSCDTEEESHSEGDV